MARGLTRRSIRALVASSATAAASIAVAGCGTQNGQTLAKEACAYVTSSITTYDSSLTIKNAAAKTRVLQKAYDELELALQPAALATSDDSRWQALMTTISEGSRVPEGVLVNALQQQCAYVNSNGGTPQVPGTDGATPATTTSVT